MIKTIEEIRLLVCEKCGMKLTDRPRFDFHDHIYCYRCAKKETKRTEVVQYEDKRQEYRQQEVLLEKLLEEYKQEKRKWDAKRDKWVYKNGLTFGRFMFYYGILLLVLIAINVILFSIGIIIGLPLWSYLHDERKNRLQSEFSQNAPSPIAPSIKLEKPTLKELDDLKIIFFDSEWNVINSHPRNKILKRDRKTCQSCGNDKPDAQLEVHHVLPKNHGGPNCDSNLITLCLFCHDHEYWLGHVRSYPTTFAKEVKRRTFKRYRRYN